MTFEGLFLHSIEINQFVDSPEYDSVTQFDVEEKFQVKFTVFITKTCLYNLDPLKPHFYIVKLVCNVTGVYIIFLISAQKNRLWVLVRTAISEFFI